jgi:hypothetical protein
MAAGGCFSQILWLIQQLLDYDLKPSCASIMCHNTITMNLTKYSVLHTPTKNIEIRHTSFP